MSDTEYMQYCEKCGSELQAGECFGICEDWEMAEEWEKNQGEDDDG